MFCRNCGKDIVGNPKLCANCGSPPVKGTSFCRYCGGPTSDQDVACPKCEAAIKVTGKAGQGWSAKTKKRLIGAAVIVVVVYAVLATPTRIIIKPLQAAISSWVLSTIGYTSNPLRLISAKPYEIPVPVLNPREDQGNIARFAVGQTQQLNISAMYTKGNSNGTGISKDVTNNCTFRSSNDQIATVSLTGIVRGVATGTAYITVTYTAIPGSADLSSAAKGKIPITLTISVLVTVS